MDATYTMLASRVPYLTEKVDSLNRRAEKLGLPGLTTYVLRTETVDDLDRGPLIPHGPDGKPVWRKKQISEVRLVGETPKLAGWSLVACIEPHDAGNVLRVVPGREGVPERYRTATLWCDHCQTERRRKETYILYHEGGRWAQVGSSCIKDFLGGLDPHGLAEYLEAVLSLHGLATGGDGDWEAMGWRNTPSWAPDTILNAAALAIRLWGWRSRTKSQEGYGPATADDVRALVDPPLEGKRKAELAEAWAKFDDAVDGRAAREALAWARGLGADGQKLSDYLHNLRVILSDEAIDGRGIGLACSAIAAHARATERELTNKRWSRVAAASAYQGEVGKRMEIEAEVVGYRTREGEWGTTHLYKLLDDADNLYTWFGSKTLYDAEGRHPRLGDRVRVRTTVKKHETFRGIRQTIITRTSLLEIKEFSEEVAK